MEGDGYRWDGEVLIYRFDGDGLVPREVLARLGEALRAEGGTPRPAGRAVVEFANEATARANADRLAFAGVVAMFAGAEVASASRIAVRGDFGLE